MLYGSRLDDGRSWQVEEHGSSARALYRKIGSGDVSYVVSGSGDELGEAKASYFVGRAPITGLPSLHELFSSAEAGP